MRKLINKIKQIWGKIKNIFKVKKMDFEFPNVIVKILEDKIDVEKNGKTDGNNNIPNSDSTHLSVCENEAVVQITELKNREVKKASEVLKNVMEKISKSQAELDRENFHIAEFVNNSDTELSTADARLSNLKDIFDHEKQQVKKFKLENHLSREPRPLTAAKMLIGFFIIGFLFVIELWVNSNLLAPAMSSGLVEGMSIAAAVAGLNVFVSFGVGYVALKNFHHTKISIRIISQICLSIYLIFIFYLNWSLGAYRAIHEGTGTNAQDILLGNASIDTSALQAHFPWTIDLTFTSLILVFVGIGFAIGSLIDGYLFNDRYPGYGSISKDRNENHTEIHRLRERLSPETIKIRTKEIRKTNEKKQSVIENILRKEWEPNKTELQNIFDGYKKFAIELNEALTHAIGEYRRINEIIRNTPVPAYFKTDLGKKMPEDYLDPAKVFIGYSDVYLSKSQIEQKNADYQNKIQDEGNEYIKQVNNHFENVLNPRIEKLREKYDVKLD